MIAAGGMGITIDKDRKLDMYEYSEHGRGSGSVGGTPNRLETVRDPPVIALLYKAFTDPECDVRNTAVEQIGEYLKISFDEADKGQTVGLSWDK